MVLDASALLALLYEETGCAQVEAAIVKGAAMSAANLAEAGARMQLDGWNTQEISNVIHSFKLNVIPVDFEVAMLSAAYRRATKPLGLSLGDRLCLATAKLADMPVLTADQEWLNVEISGLNVTSIR